MHAWTLADVRQELVLPHILELRQIVQQGLFFADPTWHQFVDSVTKEMLDNSGQSYHLKGFINVVTVQTSEEQSEEGSAEMRNYMERCNIPCLGCEACSLPVASLISQALCTHRQSKPDINVASSFHDVLR